MTSLEAWHDKPFSESGLTIIAERHLFAVFPDGQRDSVFAKIAVSEDFNPAPDISDEVYKYVILMKSVRRLHESGHVSDRSPIEAVYKREIVDGNLDSMHTLSGALYTARTLLEYDASEHDYQLYFIPTDQNPELLYEYTRDFDLD